MHMYYSISDNILAFIQLLNERWYNTDESFLLSSSYSFFFFIFGISYDK